MPSAKQLMALLESHLDGDDQRFLSTAIQLAADEARQGHTRVAQQLRKLVERGRSRQAILEPVPSLVPMVQPKGELASLLSVSMPTTRLADMVLESGLKTRLNRILLEQSQGEKLRAHDLQPRRKLLLIGPPGSGKTMTASVIAAEMHVPLFTTLLEGVITKFMGETAQKLRLVFDAIARSKAVYLFDEFDAIGGRRTASNDVGEVRRILNAFLQMLESDRSQSTIIAATNHPELLDRALFRRFDDVLEYRLPTPEAVRDILEARLGTFELRNVQWDEIAAAAAGLSQADVARAGDDAAKTAILQDRKTTGTSEIIAALEERRHSRI